MRYTETTLSPFTFLCILQRIIILGLLHIQISFDYRRYLISVSVVRNTETLKRNARLYFFFLFKELFVRTF